MSRTVRALMAGTIPSAMAWRAKSALVQCVMCNPSAIGSRQASSTIWARCRGGKLLRTTRSGFVGQQGRQSPLFIAPTNAPGRCLITLHPEGHGLDALSGRNRQDEARMLDLKARQGTAVGDALEVGGILRSDDEGTRFPTAHGKLSSGVAGFTSIVPRDRNFLHYFVPGPLDITG